MVTLEDLLGWLLSLEAGIALRNEYEGALRAAAVQVAIAQLEDNSKAVAKYEADALYMTGRVQLVEETLRQWCRVDTWPEVITLVTDVRVRYEAATLLLVGWRKAQALLELVAADGDKDDCSHQDCIDLCDQAYRTYTMQLELAEAKLPEGSTQ